MTYERRTVKAQAPFSGCGLHGGQSVRVVVRPGADGIRFFHAGAVTPASPEAVTDTTRCTRLGDISTVEHLMSALAGLEITDADIEVEGSEIPALDGSAREFVAGLTDAGFESIGTADVPPPFSRIFTHYDRIKIAISKGNGHWRYEFDAGDRWPGLQTYETRDATADYPSQIAPARTFAFATEVDELRKRGLGLGLDEESAVVIEQSGYRHPPRFADEPARHKLLDLIGDLYLAGIPIRFLNVAAERAGHRANVEAARLLALACRSVEPS